MYNRILWKDHSISPEETYNIVKNADGTVTLTPHGTVIQQGTNMSAVNFNNLETGVLASNITGLEAIRLISMLTDKVAGIEGTTVEGNLTNSLNYPFNNSSFTVPLIGAAERSSKDYTVTVEVIDCTGGGIKDIVITDKQLNGFKVSYTGSAKTAKIKCYVKGGTY
ncbi:MAG: hypothetical protein RR162_00335 [Oscillospiraceae bacterium]